ncbi:hypothetical protein POTOM_049237 [Populus tomentosa]|uniref:CCHC-type domain-containing protein n=1 Tax=Populus tomentosa TaxID=118781 RepID=A0A8X7YA08_POPTO|nr:hypothetical protein POTOM_049237 [Populus tomentosa]
MCEAEAPPVLGELNDPMEDGDTITAASGIEGCSYCGGLGHGIRECPKLEHRRGQQLAISRTDYFGIRDLYALLNGWDTMERLLSTFMMWNR